MQPIRSGLYWQCPLCGIRWARTETVYWCIDDDLAKWYRTLCNQ